MNNDNLEKKMRFYDELATYYRDGFKIVVDKTWEETHPENHFEPQDAIKICKMIDNGDSDWFTLRVRVMLSDQVLGTDYLGCCCYEDAHEVLNDGVAEDCIEVAMKEAYANIRNLLESIRRVGIDIPSKACA